MKSPMGMDTPALNRPVRRNRGPPSSLRGARMFELPDDIAGCVLYLVRDAAYVTGQVIAVDGGRSIGW